MTSPTRTDGTVFGSSGHAPSTPSNTAGGQSTGERKPKRVNFATDGDQVIPTRDGRALTQTDDFSPATCSDSSASPFTPDDAQFHSRHLPMSPTPAGSGPMFSVEQQVMQWDTPNSSGHLELDAQASIHSGHGKYPTHSHPIEPLRYSGHPEVMTPSAPALLHNIPLPVPSDPFASPSLFSQGPPPLMGRLQPRSTELHRLLAYSDNRPALKFDLRDSFDRISVAQTTLHISKVPVLNEPAVQRDVSRDNIFRMVIRFTPTNNGLPIAPGNLEFELGRKQLSVHEVLKGICNHLKKHEDIQSADRSTKALLDWAAQTRVARYWHNLDGDDRANAPEEHATVDLLGHCVHWRGLKAAGVLNGVEYWDLVTVSDA